MASNYPNILADVKTLSAVAAPALTQAIRKVIEVFASDTLPLMIIIPDFDFNEAEAFEGQITVRYKVGICTVYEGNQAYETGINSPMNTIASIRQHLNVTTLPTATTGADPPGVYDSDWKDNPEFDVDAIAGNYDYQLLEMTYLSAELRNP